MKRFKMVMALAGAMSAVAPVAQGADWNTGIKDYRYAGVPVPAPIPVMEHFRWYLRADVGIGMASSVDVSERGLVYGTDPDFGAIAPFGTTSSWFTSDFDTFVTGGAGVGAYFSPRLRGDITVDVRTKGEVESNHTYSYDRYTFGPLTPVPGETVNGHTIEKTTVRGVVSLANLYWDFTERGRGWTPYVGIGAGFVVRTMDRDHTTTENVVDGGGGVLDTRTFSGSGKATAVAPAASATFGVAYDLSPGTVFDFNYRYTYLGQVDFSTTINGQSSRMTIGDTHEHALRAGIRWNVW